MTVNELMIIIIFGSLGGVIGHIIALFVMEKWRDCQYCKMIRKDKNENN